MSTEHARTGPRMVLTLEWQEDGEFRLTSAVDGPQTWRPTVPRVARFYGLDAALGWAQAEFIRVSLAERKPLTYVSGLDPEDAPSLAQPGLPF